MSKNDVDVEDPEKLHNDSGNNLQESNSKLLNAKIEGEVETFPPAAAVPRIVNEKESGGEDLNKCKTEVKEMTEVKEQINPSTEAESTIEGSVSGEINTKCENEEEMNIKSENKEEIHSETKSETAPITTVGKQIDAENEIVEQKATTGGLDENKSSENCLEIVEQRPNEDAANLKLKEIGAVETDFAEHISGGELTMGNADAGNKDEEMEGARNFDYSTSKDNEQAVGTVSATRETDENDNTIEIVAKNDGEESSLSHQHADAKAELLSRCSSAKPVDHNGDMAISVSAQPTQLHLIGESDDGTPEDQTAFMKELESFYRERTGDFKPPKFYGQPLNCLKLWRSVIRLGGYDRVTGSKLWRQVGESFHPPKTCTTVSWTFRIFYEKSLLDFERHKTQSGELQLPVPMLPEVTGLDGEGNGGSGPGRARRDAAARAMQGWHAQRLSDSGEVKNVSNMAKHEKNIKSIGSLKQKRPNEVEHSSKAARIESPKQLVTSVVDIGPPADWVKINVRQTKDCFEVYALVPGLLREEVRVQSDPAGRVVITGQPEQVDNPWGITSFKKVVSLPARIDPLQTSAVVSLHGRLFVRVPYEQLNT